MPGRPRKKIELTGELWTCSRCRSVKDRAEFPPNRKRCLACSRELMKDQKQLGKNTTNYKKRDMIRAAKSEPCARCGESFPYYVMDLDHLPAHKKSFSLGKYMYHSLAEIEAEIAKCQALCANCHRIVTHERGFASEF